MNLSDIVQFAQGGQAIDNLAARFGLTPDQAQRAVQALLPAFQMGLQNRAATGGVGSILAHLGNPAHQEAYADAGAAQSGGAQAGGAVLGDLFGGAHAQVAQQASSQSGVSATIIQAMLPMIASMIMGGLFHAAQSSGGLGGLLGSLIGAATGGGSGPGPGQGGPIGQGPAAAPTQGGGDLGGVLGSVLGGLLGGGAPQGNTPRAGDAEPYVPASPGAAADAGQSVQSGSSNAALDDLSRMFQAGTPAAPIHEAKLAAVLGRSAG